MYIIMSRLATTDSMLNMSWMAALAFGYFAVKRTQPAWPWLMWLAVAVGLFTKGPLALAPVGIILLWLAFAGRFRDMRRLHLLLGFILAAIPLGVWVGLVLSNHEDALAVWKFELVDRATGNGKHPEPWWYYVPIFLGGLFPATAMMMLPGWNASPRRCWREMRSGSAVALLILAVVIPFIGFSLMTGKLASYLLPVCGPLAILNGLMLEQWLCGSMGRTPGGLRLPDVRYTLLTSITIVFLVCLGAALWYSPWMAANLAPMALLIAACVWLCRVWKRQPELRGLGLALIWGVWIFNWWIFFEVEDKVASQRDTPQLIAHLRDLTGSDRPMIFTYGFTDPTLSFYNDDDAQRLRNNADGRALLAQSGAATVVLVDDAQWNQYTTEFPPDKTGFEDVGRWRRNMLSAAHIMRRIERPSAETTGAQTEPTEIDSSV
jgi:4-amino-4-deoxy-L-arabinose transferase-like glycosyltransferase